MPRQGRLNIVSCLNVKGVMTATRRDRSELPRPSRRNFRSLLLNPDKLARIISAMPCFGKNNILDRRISRRRSREYPYCASLSVPLPPRKPFPAGRRNDTLFSAQLQSGIIRFCWDYNNTNTFLFTARYQRIELIAQNPHRFNLNPNIITYIAFILPTLFF